MNDLAGKFAFYIGVHISPDEMKDWHPDRIKAFFKGIARIKAAVENLSDPTSRGRKRDDPNGD